MHLKKEINNFIFHIKYEKNLSSKTIKAYQNDLTQFLQFLTNKKIDQIKKEEIKGFIFYLYSKNYKPKTIKRKITTLKIFFNFLEFEEKFFSYLM